MGPEPSKSSAFGERSFDDRVRLDAERSTDRTKTKGPASACPPDRSVPSLLGSTAYREQTPLGFTSTPAPAATHALQ
jgi:hypothetical protein